MLGHNTILAMHLACLFHFCHLKAKVFIERESVYCVVSCTNQYLNRSHSSVMHSFILLFICVYVFVYMLQLQYQAGVCE